MAAVSGFRDFLAEGAMVAAPSGGSIGRMAAGLGLAAFLSFAPGAAFSGECHSAVLPVAAADASGHVLPSSSSTLTYGVAEEILNSHVSELMENSVIHDYGGYKVPQSVVRQIVRAAEDTGFPADYLMAIAEKESSFRADARASTSSAKGYMGFIEQSWLSAVKRFGADFGLAEEAASIGTKTARNGAPVYFVEDPETESRILAFREDPYVSSVMAAMDLKEARRRIEEKLETSLSDADLYLPHFMGEDAARKVIAKAIDDPDASAARLFPKAARANRAMFSDGGGGTITVSEFRERLQGVISKRADKYGAVVKDVAKASLIKNEETIRQLARDHVTPSDEHKGWRVSVAAL